MKFNIPTIRLSLTNLLPIFALLILFSACTKENTALSDQEMADTPELNALVLLADDENTENNEINQLIYLFGRAIQEAAQQPELMSYMVESMEADVNGFGASILTMSSNNHIFSEVIENSLLASIHKEKMEHLIEYQQTDGHSIMNVLANKLLCQGITYQPVIYRLTREEVSPRNQDVVIAIAEEVTDEDEVLAYRNDEDIPFLLGEEEASTITDNLIFVGVGDIPKYEINPIIVGETPQISEDNESVTYRVDIDIDADRHQIKAGHRYENSKKSEVRCWITKFFQGQNNPWSLANWQDFSSRKIHKNDINSSKIFTGDEDAFGFNPTDFNNNVSAFVGGWEYDWYASLKLVANPCSTFGDHSVGVKMKFSHEWYFFDCDEANNWWPNVGSHEIFENQKCMFDMKRTQ